MGIIEASLNWMYGEMVLENRLEDELEYWNVGEGILRSY